MVHSVVLRVSNDRSTLIRFVLLPHLFYGIPFEIVVAG